MMHKKYIVPACIYVCTLAFLLIVLASVTHAESISKEDFIVESTQAWDELLSIYKEKGVEMSFQRQRFYDEDEYIHSRVCVLGNYQLNEAESEEKKAMRVANDRYAFEIHQEQNAHWSIRNVLSSPEDMIETSNHLSLLSLTPYVYPALIVQDCWLKDIVTSDSFVIESLHESKDNPNLITLEFSIDYDISEIQTLTHGSLVLDKNQYWIVLHSEVTLVETNNEPIEYLLTAEKKYKSIDGIPFPVTVIDTLTPQNTAAESVPKRSNVYYDDPIIGISKNVFYLNHYGISEPEEPTPEEPTLEEPPRQVDVVRIVLITAGVLLIIFGLYLRWSAAKKR